MKVQKQNIWREIDPKEGGTRGEGYGKKKIIGITRSKARTIKPGGKGGEVRKSGT